MRASHRILFTWTLLVAMCFALVWVRISPASYDSGALPAIQGRREPSACVGATCTPRILLLKGYLRQWEKTRGYWKEFCAQTNSLVILATFQESYEKSTRVRDTVDIEQIIQDLSPCKVIPYIFDNGGALAANLVRVAGKIDERLQQNPNFQLTANSTKRHWVQHVIVDLALQNYLQNRVDNTNCFIVISRTDIMIERKPSTTVSSSNALLDEAVNFGVCSEAFSHFEPAKHDIFRYMRDRNLTLTRMSDFFWATSSDEFLRLELFEDVYATLNPSHTRWNTTGFYNGEGNFHARIHHTGVTDVRNDFDAFIMRPNLQCLKKRVALDGDKSKVSR